jgi:hypothetical protein
MPGRRTVFGCFFGLWSISCGAFGQEIPTGFKFERYAQLCERNPFTLAEPPVQKTQPSMFDRLFVASWLTDNGKNVVLVQNSETNELQTVTDVPNQHDLRLVAIHPNLNPQLVEVLISNGKEEGRLKFRGDDHLPAVQPPAGQESSQGQTANGPRGAPSSQSHGLSPTATPIPGAAHSVYPGMPRIYHEGGSVPNPGPKQVPRKHPVRDPSAGQ